MNIALPPSSSGFDRPMTYRICVLGRIPTRWRDRLEGMVISETTDQSKLPMTTLEGELADQSALAGVLNTIVELHLIVQSVENLPRRNSMTLGPVDFIALEFPGNRFKGEILPDLFELVDTGVAMIRFDSVVLEHLNRTPSQVGSFFKKEPRGS